MGPGTSRIQDGSRLGTHMRHSVVGVDYTL